MKRSFLVVVPVLVPAVLLLAGAAYATHWGATTPLADCEGWSFAGYVQFNTLPSANVVWEVTLTEGATTVCTYSGTTTVYSTGQGSSVPFSASNAWCEKLCGDYTVQGSFHIDAPPGETRYLAVDLSCDCPGTVCRHTPCWWKLHCDEWPVSSLTLGGRNYGEQELKRILGFQSGDGIVMTLLTQQLIAAKLNVANGADDSAIAGQMAGADRWVSIYGVSGRPKLRDLVPIIRVGLALALWNWQPCCEDGPNKALAAKPDEILQLENLLEQASGAQDETWGSVKGLYGD